MGIGVASQPLHAFLRSVMEFSGEFAECMRPFEPVLRLVKDSSLDLGAPDLVVVVIGAVALRERPPETRKWRRLDASLASY